MNTKAYKFLKFEMDDLVGILTISRPEKLNALNIELLEELESFYSMLIHEMSFQSLRGLIMTGEGEKSFIAGADIGEMAPMSKNEAEKLSHLGQRVTCLIEETPIPTIAAVNGFALGGGFEMALAHDFIYATKNVILGLPEVSLGLIPGFGGTQRLVRIVGRQKAKEMIFLGKKIKGDEALQMGAVLYIFETKKEMLENAKRFILKTSLNSPTALAASKSALFEGVDLPVKKGLEIESRHFCHLFEMNEMKEGTAAFLEKRKADFQNNQN